MRQICIYFKDINIFIIILFKSAFFYSTRRNDKMQLSVFCIHLIRDFVCKIPIAFDVKDSRLFFIKIARGPEGTPTKYCFWFEDFNLLAKIIF